MESMVCYIIGVVMGTLLGIGLYDDSISDWVDRGNFTHENVTYKIVKADVVVHSDTVAQQSNTNIEEK